MCKQRAPACKSPSHHELFLCRGPHDHVGRNCWAVNKQLTLLPWIYLTEQNHSWKMEVFQSFPPQFRFLLGMDDCPYLVLGLDYEIIHHFTLFLLISVNFSLVISFPLPPPKTAGIYILTNCKYSYSKHLSSSFFLLRLFKKLVWTSYPARQSPVLPMASWMNLKKWWE